MKSFGMQPHFSQSSDCSACSTNWGPNVDLWQASCNFFCNPAATVDDDLPTDCYDSNGKVVNECVGFATHAQVASQNGIMKYVPG